jgi:hypothetical protein
MRTPTATIDHTTGNGQWKKTPESKPHKQKLQEHSTIQAPASTVLAKWSKMLLLMLVLASNLCE